jgi:hypothetical protein
MTSDDDPGTHVELVDVRLAREQRLAVPELRSEAPEGPDIDGGAVPGVANEQLGGAVPGGVAVDGWQWLGGRGWVAVAETGGSVVAVDEWQWQRQVAVDGWQSGGRQVAVAVAEWQWMSGRDRWQWMSGGQVAVDGWQSGGRQVAVAETGGSG